MDPTDDTESGSQRSKSPVEKLRIRLAAETYNTNYEVMKEDSDGEHTKDGSKKKCSWGQCGPSISPCIVLFAIGILLVVGFALLSILLKIRLDQVNNNCQSPDCVITSGTMLSKMDETIDRCTDFYQYACSGFFTDVTIPADQLRYSVLSGDIEHRRLARIRKLLEVDGSEFKGQNSTAVAKARQYYAACMDIKAIEDRGNTPMFNLIKSVGGWSVTSDPVSGVWNASGFSMESSLVASNLLGFTPFFEVYVAPDDKNSSVNIIHFDQSGLSFPSYDSYVGNSSESYHKAFVDFFASVTKLLGSQQDTRSLAQDVWELERAIAEAFVRPEDRADVYSVYHIMTVDEFQQYFGSVFDVQKFLELTYGKKFSPSVKLNVKVPIYFRKLGLLMQFAMQRDVRTVANYMTWISVESMVPLMPIPFRLTLLELRRAIYGVQSETPRWEGCVAGTDGSLGFATGALYIEKYFSEMERQMVETVYDLVLASFKQRLLHVTWMDEITKLRALDKAKAITHKIGYPDFVTSPTELDKFYAQCTITNDSFENVLSVARFETMKNRNRLGQMPDKDEWLMSPAEVNAYYEPSVNQVVLPAGILQKPLFDSTFPMSLIFGSLGFIIGHEITHGFDNTGRHFDKYGNLVEWWGNKSAQQFSALSQCFVDEYSDFIIYGHHANGVSTLGENIADNGGLRISYNAFRSLFEKQNFNDAVLPGLNMTVNQQFFLGFAQTWCSYYQPEYAIQLLVLDVHSNSRDRVNGVLRNMPEFTEAFNCKSTSPMNPPNKCSLW